VKKANVVTAADLAAGEIGAVVSIEGGHQLHNRLEALGIRSGKKIRKVSSAFMRGPSILEVDGCNIAIGYGMATRILIKTD